MQCLAEHLYCYANLKRFNEVLKMLRCALHNVLRKTVSSPTHSPPQYDV